MDVQKACKELLSKIEQIFLAKSLPYSFNGIKEHVDFLNSLFNGDFPQNNHKILNVISELLLHPPLTLPISELFRPVLIDLTSRWLYPDDAYHTNNSAVFRVESVALAFSQLLPLAPQLLSVSVSFFSRSPSLLLRLDSIGKSSETEEMEAFCSPDVMDIKCLLMIAYRLLRFSERTFVPLWNWSSLFQLLTNSDNSIRYLTVLCISIVFNMSDAQREIAYRIWVGPKEERILIDWEDTGTFDIRMLTLLEHGSLIRKQLHLTKDNCDDLSRSTPLEFEEFSKLTANISGILLPRSIQSVNMDNLENKPRLMMTETTQNNLNAICLAISMGSPVLLEGVTGSGKTALVEEIAISTGHYEGLLKIHLGEQTDSKTLLGTYVSTSTSALFHWQPGVLTTAVREGRWVLIEDIDLAPVDVLSVLLPLLETSQLFIPNRGERIEAKQGFQLFATRSLLQKKDEYFSRHPTTDMSIGNTLWTKIRIKPMSSDELKYVIGKKFPPLHSLVTDLTNVFTSITSIYQDKTLFPSNIARAISSRDLMKWCERIDSILNLKDSVGNYIDGLSSKVREEIFREAADSFCAFISDYSVWTRVLELLGEKLGITNQWIELYASSFIPNISISVNVIIIGRSHLVPNNRKKRNSLKRGAQKNHFTDTGHALRLLEQISVCVQLCEPVLLVGETGTGKTSVVQHLADLMNQNLIVVNLSQHSDISDLLGGFKPVDANLIAAPLKEEFDKLFEKTFSVRRNPSFLQTVNKMYVKKRYNKFVSLLRQAIGLAEQKFNSEQDQHFEMEIEYENQDKEIQKNPRKLTNPELRNRWKMFESSVREFEIQQDRMRNKLIFAYIEGSLVKAVIKGDWILLDEINLASTETLECLSGLLQDSKSSLLLTERGDSKPISRHPNFRIFACMNPATDVGKRDLPPGLRSRFSEFYVHPPDNNRDDLLSIVRKYLAGCIHGDEQACVDIVEFYLSIKDLMRQYMLSDGSNQIPHFSMRTLTRALMFVSHIAPIYGLRRSMYESFCMTFLTQLNKESEMRARDLLQKYLLGGVKNPLALLSQIPRAPTDGKYLQFGHFWLKKGDFQPEEVSNYILTPSVNKNLENLSRVVMSNRFPVLLQGPTSAGKTSMIHYLAKLTGHRFVRINNHEHTDLQEYLGTYVSNSEGKLEFQEGILVESVRKGYWLVLDELNLAPTDVLEALNRLLDDNRELLIPETQEVIKPHKDFMLFATQNPPGLYAGRKVLSRAFRSRFVELHFDDIPESELETILSERCRIAPSYCKRMVQTYKQLMERRQRTRIFEQKHGFITLRDLFRWAERGAIGYQELAENGYMLLAERVRRPDEKLVVKEVLENVMKVTIEEQKMYDRFQSEFSKFRQNDIIWTKAMKRLFTLVFQCLKFNEPVLLVGDTGCGKTFVCQMLTKAMNTELVTVNCHHSTETADLLGGQRPLRNRGFFNFKLKCDLIEYLRKNDIFRETLEELDLPELIELLERDYREYKAEDLSKLEENDELMSLLLRCRQSRKLFEWCDGPLIQAMKKGTFFLLDEISLADDSVIERINSVLEPHRTLVLPEKGVGSVEELVANRGFQFLATMNPGGDYGKKELSPALRNRFTEIWVPSVSDRDDLLQIIDAQLIHPAFEGYACHILDFINWFTSITGFRHVISIRDILSWVQFMNISVEFLGPKESFIHGGCLTLLDGLGSSTSQAFLSGHHLKNIRIKCLEKLKDLSRDSDHFDNSKYDVRTRNIYSAEMHFGIYPFFISRGLETQNFSFNFQAPTTAENAIRILRAMQVRKPILLEGSPGVGKTSLVTALAAASGHRLVRINLSDQTDLMDLFGSDFPVEGGRSGEFAWCDAPFLKAMQNGDWVLLDELNLASQSVLEGLNSCLDHRGTVYIPELDKEFHCAQEFRVFGAQNPFHQGGGRKGLPKSFINRFTQVYIEELTQDDVLLICVNSFPRMDIKTLKSMIEFNTRMYEDTMIKCLYGRNGAPWEFNLRDILRWLELLAEDYERGIYSLPHQFLDLVYLMRMRTSNDRDRVISTFNEIFDNSYHQPRNPSYHINPDFVQIGYSILRRRDNTHKRSLANSLHILQSHLLSLQSLMKCVEMNWMAILTGPEATGKTSLVRLLAELTGNKLEEFSMNSTVDTTELLGGFEQVDLSRHRQIVINELIDVSDEVSKSLLIRSIPLHGDFQILQAVTQFGHLTFTLKNYQKFNNFNQANSSIMDFNLIDQLLTLLDQTIRDFNLPSKNSLQSLSEKIKKLKSMENEIIAGRFEWIDGVLINALLNGHWLLIDNANLCSPSVLDRLNPLLEPNGFLMVNEQGVTDGKTKIIYPHENFRLFMTVDPKNGELSRAMRNRGIEIALLKDESTNIRDLIKISYGLGLHLPCMPEILERFSKTFENFCGTSCHRPSLREYIMFIRFLNERIQRGESTLSATNKVFQLIFEYSEKGNLEENDFGFLKFSSFPDLNVQENNFLHTCSPSNYPFFIGGGFFKDESIIAMISLQGSYLLQLLLKNESNLSEHDLIPNISPEILVAIDYFVEISSQDDLNVRHSWLDFVSSILQSSYFIVHRKQSALEYAKFLLNSVLTHPVATQITELRSRLINSINLDCSLALNKPLDITNIPYFHKIFTDIGSGLLNHDNVDTKLALWKEYSFKTKTFLILKRLTRSEYFESSSYKSASQLKVTKMTIAQQSYIYHQGMLYENQLSHRIIGNIYSLLQKSMQFVKTLIEVGEVLDSDGLSLINDFLDQRDFLWKSLQTNLFIFGDASVNIKLLHEKATKICERYYKEAKPLVNVLKTLTEDMSLTTGIFMINIWKDFHHVTLKKFELFQLEQELSSMAKKFDNIGYNEDFRELKNMIIDAIATLFFIDENPREKTDELLISIKRIPEVIHNKMEVSKVEGDISECSRQDMFVPQNLIMDYWSIIKEMEIIGNLQSIVLNSSSNDYNFGSFIHQLSEWRDWSLKHSSRNPLDFVSHQKILWNYGDGSKDKIKIMLNNTVQDVMFSWHNRLWNNSFDQFFVGERSDTSKNFIKHSGGPSRLFQSVFTECYLNYSNMIQSTSIGNYEICLKQLEEFENRVGSSHMFSKTNRKTINILCLILHFGQILYPFQYLFSSDDWNDIYSNLDIVVKTIRSLLETNGNSNDRLSNAVQSLYSISHALKKVRDSSLLSTFERWFVPVILLMIQLIENYHDFLGKNQYFLITGKSWVLMSLGFISLYIPDYPLDPTTEARTKCKQLQIKQSSLETEIKTRSDIEKCITGNSENSLIEHLKKDLENVRSLYEKERVDLVLRPEDSQINNIFKDIDYICNNVIDEKHIATLTEDLEKGQNTPALDREALFQENTSQFIQRVTTNYPLYRDLLQPICVTLFQLKYGVRLMASPQYKSREIHIFDLVMSLMEMAKLGYPNEHVRLISSPNSIKKIKELLFSASPNEDKWDTYLKYITVVLRCLYHHIAKRGHFVFEDLEIINFFFGETADIYSAAEERMNSLAREKESLYKNKTKTYTDINDDQHDGHEEMFPDFSREFSEFSSDVENIDMDPKIIKNNVSIVNEEIIFEIGELYKHIITDFKYYLVTDIVDRSQLMRKIFWPSFTMARNLTLLSGNLYPEEFDDKFTTTQMLSTFLLKSWLMQGTELENSDRKPFLNDRMYDFYKDENIAEAKKLGIVVRNFQIRIKELLKLWPEHAVLHQLYNICDKISGLELNSPIAKLLTGLEILLQKSEDWESYASRDVSIKSNREEVTELIIRWRQLELTCWPKLLAAQDKYYMQSSLKWWFHLYGCIIRPIYEISRQYNVGEATPIIKDHVTEIVKSLDQFIQSSNFGEFESRLELIRVFYIHLCNHFPTHNPLYDRAANALWNVYKYYSQFRDELRTSLGILRKPIEKELCQFVKIASWKDVNVHALKQSAQKTHRHLSKCIRKYKEILDRSIIDILRVSPNDHPNAQHKEKGQDAHSGSTLFPPPEKWLSDIYPIEPSEKVFELQQTLSKQGPLSPERFININNTFQKFRSYCLNDIFGRNSTCGFYVDDLATEIILRSKALQDETNLAINEENKSSLKNLKLVKKKSLVDLLKELKRVGLHSFPNRKALEKQQNLGEYILQLPRLQPLTDTLKTLVAKYHSTYQLPMEKETILMSEKIDDYYYRIISRINYLRHISASHSKDISSQEARKALGFTEDLLSLIIQERRWFIEFETQYKEFSAFMIQLGDVYSAYKPTSSNSQTHEVVSLNSLHENELRILKEIFDNTLCMLTYSKTIFDIQKQFLRLPENDSIDRDIQSWFGTISTARQEVNDVFERMILMPELAVGKKVVLTTKIIGTLKTHGRTINMFHEFLSQICTRFSEYSHIFSPMRDYINSRSEIFETSDVECETINLDNEVKLILENFTHKVGDLLDCVLINVQNLVKINAQENADVAENDPPHVDHGQMCDNHIRHEHNHISDITKKLNLKSTNEQLGQIYSLLSQFIDNERLNNNKCQTLISYLLQRIFPFMHQYYNVIQYYLTTFLFHQKSLCKLELVLCNSFVTIFEKGFCTPEISEAEDGESGDVDQNLQGTGIGGGEGSKDVSNEIEDEEQVLGTQNEVESKPSEGTDVDKKDGIEMENDFEGTLEDIERSNDNDDQTEDEDSKSDIEEQVGQLDDSDPDVVDEKMWGEDSADKDSGKSLESNKQENLQGDSDIVAKDDSKGGLDDNEQKQQLPKENNDYDIDENEPEDFAGDQLEEYNDQEIQFNDEIPQAETMELPDDMEIDGMEEDLNDLEDGCPDEDFSSEMDLDNSNCEVEKLPEEDVTEGQENIDSPNNPMETEELEELVNTCSNKQGEEGPESETDEMVENEPDEMIENEPDEMIDKTSDQVKNNEEQSLNKSFQENPNNTSKSLSSDQDQVNSEITAENTHGVDGKSGMTTMVPEATPRGGMPQSPENTYDQKKEVEKLPNTTSMDNLNNFDDEKVDKRDTSKIEYPNDEIRDANPHRSLGDALEKWRRRLGMIEKNDSSDLKNEKLDENNDIDKQEDIDEGQAFEYIENDEMTYDLQVMEGTNDERPMDVGDTTSAEDHIYESNDIPVEVKDTNCMKPDELVYDDKTSQEPEDHGKSALFAGKRGMEPDNEEQMVDDSLIIQSQPPLSQLNVESLRQDLEMKLQEWRQSGRSIDAARELWQKYENLTYDLANGLCEQLRLILEPTLATRLKGDYRTGRRLNMKKIIPYIASDFKKDKIWLRRTKPSKRQYQVMIAVDDSKSMCETHSIQLAYETLALISKALSQLEVGDISIVSFGEKVQMLHPFDQPFSSEAGAQVLQQFTFEQKKTYIRSLMETSIALLEHARNNYNGRSQQKELWQLQLIISDGVCEDHDSLKALVRRAIEAQIMVVFIIVDNKSGSDSIVSMNQVKYKSVNGRMTLEMVRYLDSFPFDYYVVLRDVNALSETLADALRQYFSIIGQNSS
ncbi:2742_t:CDS:10 [Acaulospora morrowiae]|uniref:Midasin n=1 Tax=Acaulospora morrowiae TaxID=94023 RepID=A0A9N8V523_9GLOM|nr:2742_t:CDS:10 [Acaulospora morrowiae]